MKKVLLCYAHCDDELIWGHPWLLDKSYECRVLICSSAQNDPNRQQYRRDAESLRAVCDAVGVTDVRVLSEFFGDFYSLPARGNKTPLLREWWSATQSALLDTARGCELVATHNPWGEYGHLSHVLLHRLVMETCLIPVAWTSAVSRNTAWPLGILYRQLFRKPSGRSHTSSIRINKLKQEYVSRGAWTWDFPVPNPVDIYEERA